MFTLKDVWVSFLSAIIRFWDARFQPQENETVYLLKLELERERAEKVKLLNSVLEHLNKPVISEIEENEKLPKPIGTLNWRARAAQLTADSVKRRLAREQNEAEARNALNQSANSIQSVEDLEKELNVS